MPDPLIPARLLFRFSASCRRCDPLWSAEGAGLDESHRLPSFAEVEGKPTWADVRAGYSGEGLAVVLEVRGKAQQAWCRPNRVEDSDGIQLLIDTRDVHNVHRAGRFCHRFIFLPGGAGGRMEKPLAAWLPINRAREHPRPVREGALKAVSRKFPDGYRLDCFIPAEALTGFDPAEHPRLGFTYSVIDRERGEQTFTVGTPMPHLEDPSLWGTLELTP